MTEHVWIDLGDGVSVLKSGDRVVARAEQLSLDILPEYELEYISTNNDH